MVILTDVLLEFELESGLPVAAVCGEMQFALGGATEEEAGGDVLDLEVAGVLRETPVEYLALLYFPEGVDLETVGHQVFFHQH